ALVAGREQTVTLGSEAPGVRRRTDPTRRPIEGDRPLGLKLLQVMADRVQRAAELLRELGRGRPAAPLEANQDLATRAPMADRAVGKWKVSRAGQRRSGHRSAMLRRERRFVN